MGFSWPQSSLDRKVELKPDLIKVLDRFITLTPYQCVIARGACSADEEMAIWLKCHNPDGTRNDQPWLTNCNGYPPGAVAPNGVYGTGVSNHQGGYAVDLGVIINGEYTGELKYYHATANIMLRAAASIQIPLVYGGSWPAPKTDSDHFELNRSFYP